MYGCVCFFFNDTAPTEICTLSLHDALPIWAAVVVGERDQGRRGQPPPDVALLARRTRPGLQPLPAQAARDGQRMVAQQRSEEHTSELQSRQYLVCRILLEKKTEVSHVRHPR